MGSFLYYTNRVRPEALRRWAEGLGCEILRKESIGWRRFLGGIPPFKGTLSIAQEVYSLTLRDHDGRTFQCWAKIGACWSYPLTVAAYPIEIRWDGPEPASNKRAEATHPFRDREIDG